MKDLYIQEIQRYFKDENSSEHSYRTTFENYLKEIFPTSEGYFTQQDQRAINGNKPDFIIIKNGIPVLYIEVKKVGEDLDKIEKSNQADRYFGYDNLIISDYVDFRFFRNGHKYGENIILATCDKKSRILTPVKEIETLSREILDFTHSHKEPIKSGKQLARIMGGKAQRIRDNVLDMLASEEKYIDLIKIRNVVKENLISSLDDEAFSDMYAQTLVYGLFAARYNDDSMDTFSRTEARELVPKTNPFLRSFFDHIAGESFPERLRFIVDELCEVFSHANTKELMKEYYKLDLWGKTHKAPDPIIHFYEDFLKEYDAKKKMDMGVFYTPRPVVQFIVRAVDSILKSEFGLSKGLSDTTKIQIEKKGKDAKGKEISAKKEYHKVQILDIATGTGTFLNEVINHIHADFKGQEGRWSSYVKDDLLPRLHGFELMMASYTIAHLKLGMTLRDTGVQDLNTRIGVYLTNTLEEPALIESQPSMFGVMESIVEERKSASRVKSEFPIMCVIGNPPYSGESMNPDYTDNDVYKVEPGGKQKLQERNPKWINDDYVKFIRMAESLIEKNGEGVMGMITAHGYIDNPTFRGMRWHLRKTFDKIYIIDLHGNSRKKEVSPDGSKDENAFDIMTGVSIIFGVKKSDTKDKNLAQIYKLDLYGLRNDKFKILDIESMDSFKWTELPEDNDIWVLEGAGKAEYQKGFSVAEIFPVNSVGIVTAKDAILINDTKEGLLKNVSENYNIETENSFIQKISYRPFDNKFVYFDTKLVERSREKVMQHFVNRENVGLIFKRGSGEEASAPVFITRYINESRSWSRPGMQGIESNAPLYLYVNGGEKVPNLNLEIRNKINEITGENAPENILDYIYAVLHSPKYRETYNEFLKIDFPRVPYPEDKEKFFTLAKLGEKLRVLHLMTDPSVSDFITTFPNTGSDEVEKIKYEKHLEAHEKIVGKKISLTRADIGDVWINHDQYFGNVPEIAWNFYIGGYQPAQKYLKDRKGRKLTNDEIEQYQKIIKVLVETEKIMKEIDIL